MYKKYCFAKPVKGEYLICGAPSVEDALDILELEGFKAKELRLVCSGTEDDIRYKISCKTLYFKEAIEFQFKLQSPPRAAIFQEDIRRQSSKIFLKFFLFFFGK